MAFQRIIGGRGKAAAPMIFIQARGLIEFNEGAIRKFALNRFNYAILYYEQEVAYNVFYSGEHDMYIVQLQEEKAAGSPPQTTEAHDLSKRARATRSTKSTHSSAA